MLQLRVGYARWVGALAFVIAALCLFTYVVTHAGMELALALALVLLLGGGMFSFGTIFRIKGNAVELTNAFGVTLKTLAFGSVHDLSIDGRTLWVLPKGETERKKISGLVANGRDWRALADAIASAQATVPRPGTDA